MTLTELSERVSRRLGTDREETWQICSGLVAEIVSALKAGEVVRIRGLGTFIWQLHKESRRRHPRTKQMVEIPQRFVLKFSPMESLRTREVPVMEKLGVQYDDEKVKEASKGGKGKSPNDCPDCGKDSGDSKNCPTHGTEPFEKKPQGG